MGIDVRALIERRTGPLLVYLSRLPSAVIVIVVLVLAVGGQYVRGIHAGIPLGLLTLLLAWVSYMTWPAVDRRARVVRVIVVAVGVILTVYRSSL